MENRKLRILVVDDIEFIRTGARVVQTIPRWFACSVVWLIFSFASEPAFCDTISAYRPLSLRPSAIHQSRTRIQCEGISAGSTFCETGSRQYADPNTLMQYLPPEHIYPTQSDIDPPRADLLVVFQLAMEELDLFRGLRLYWNKAERYIDELSVKLKLKGEIPIGDPSERMDGRVEATRSGFRNISARKSAGPSRLLSLFTPQTIRWNMGMNPDDLSIYMDVHLNSYLGFSGEFGDERRVGLFFKFRF